MTDTEYLPSMAAAEIVKSQRSTFRAFRENIINKLPLIKCKDDSCGCPQKGKGPRAQGPCPDKDKDCKK